MAKLNTARSENNSSQILDVLRIDDKKFSVTINLYFGVLWDELRLDIGWAEKHDRLTEGTSRGCHRPRGMSPRLILTHEVRKTL